MTAIYKVTLTTEERQTLDGIVSKGKHSDAGIAKQFHCHHNTVTKIKQRFVEQGFEAVLERKQRTPPVIEPMFDGRKEVQLIQLACSPPPEGHCTWTLQLFSDKCVELNIVEKASIGNPLKKSRATLHV